MEVDKNAVLHRALTVKGWVCGTEGVDQWELSKRIAALELRLEAMENLLLTTLNKLVTDQTNNERN